MGHRDRVNSLWMIHAGRIAEILAAHRKHRSILREKRVTLLSLAAASLELDFIFLFKIRGLPVIEKIRFVLLKYILYFRNRIFGLNTMPSRTRIFGMDYYHNEVLGLASLQRVYCESYFLAPLVSRGSVIVDIGANIGQFNFFCRQYLQAQRVISVEPVRSCYEVLKLNSQHLKDSLNFAVSDTKKKVTFHIASESSQLSSYIRNEAQAYIDTQTIDAVTLDEIVRSRNPARIDLLKIDTEGSEYDVVSSATDTLNKTGLLFIEMSVFRTASGNIFKIGTLLENNGFRLIRLITKSSHAPIDVNGIFQKS